MIAALVQVQTDNPTVELSFTLPVSPTGLPSTLQSILKRIVDSNLVFMLNIMAMDYGVGR